METLRVTAFFFATGIKKDEEPRQGDCNLLPTATVSHFPDQQHAPHPPITSISIWEDPGYQ